MQNRLTRGVLVVSVVLELDVYQRILADQRALRETTDELVTIFSRHRLPATWAVADPAASAASDGILAANGDHEMAVLGDASWVGPTAGRTRFSRELMRRTQAARARGMAASTLVLPEVAAGDHLDLLVKNGVTAVCGAPAGRLSGGQPLAVRFSLWQLSPTCQLPAGGRHWPFGHPAAGIRRELGRAVTGPRVMHLAVDAPQLAESGHSGRRQIERIVRQAAQLRDRGRLDVKTTAGLIADWSRPREATPTRSILRASA